MKSIEICAGAGGQAIGLEQAGFEHIALVEIEQAACDTLRLNRAKWNVIQKDVKEFSQLIIKCRFICRWCSLSTFFNSW